MENPDAEPLPGTIEEDKSDTLYNGVIFPSLLSRVKALFVDIVIMLAIFTVTTLIIDTVGAVPSFVRGSIAIFMFYLYDPILTSFTGSTLGHKAMNLKVRKYNDPEKRISLGQAFVRFLTKGFLGWLSFLTVTGNKRKRAIHDMTSGSIILYTK